MCRFFFIAGAAAAAFLCAFNSIKKNSVLRLEIYAMTSSLLLLSFKSDTLHTTSLVSMPVELGVGS